MWLKESEDANFLFMNEVGISLQVRRRYRSQTRRRDRGEKGPRVACIRRSPQNARPHRRAAKRVEVTASVNLNVILARTSSEPSIRLKRNLGEMTEDASLRERRVLRNFHKTHEFNPPPECTRVTRSPPTGIPGKSG